MKNFIISVSVLFMHSNSSSSYHIYQPNSIVLRGKHYNCMKDREGNRVWKKQTLHYWLCHWCLTLVSLAILCAPLRIMCDAPLCRGNTLASSALNTPSQTQTHRHCFLYTLKPDTVPYLIHNSEKRDLKCHNHITQTCSPDERSQWGSIHWHYAWSKNRRHIETFEHNDSHGHREQIETFT